MKKQFWKSFTFRQLFTCYVVIMLLSMLFNFVFYQYYDRVYTQKHEQSQQLAISQAANVIDERLSAVLNVSDAISVSSAILKTRHMTLPFTAEKYWTLHKAGKYLNTFTPLKGVVDEVYIYNHKLDCILDTGHIYTEANQLHTVVTKRIGMERAAFSALMAQAPRSRFLLIAENGSILYVNTFDMLDKKPSLTTVLVLNTDAIEKTLSDLSRTSEGCASIIENDAELFAPYAENRQSSGEYMTLTAPSQYAAFDYVLRVPMSVFMRETSAIRLIYLITVIALLIAGSIAAYLLAKRNYRPIYALGQITDVSNSTKDELAAIQNKIQEVLTSRQLMNQKIRSLNQIASYQTFHALVTGDMAYMQEHANAGLNIDFKGDIFVVALIELESVVGRQPAMNLKRSGELNVLIDNILSNLFRDTCQYICRREDETFVVVLCFPREDKESAEMKVVVKMERIPELLLSSISLTAQIFIGDAQQGLPQVHLSFMNARRAQEYAEFVGEIDKKLILYDPSMYSSEMPNQNFDIMDAERRFVNELLAGDYDQAKNILYQILTYYRCQDGISLYIMRCRMFGLMNLMINALHEIEPDITAALYKECHPIERILSAQNMRELETVLFSIVEQLIGRREHTPTDAQEKIHLIIGYIKSHYYDPNLSVQMIADEFSLSLPYLSRVFKESNDVGLLSFINQYRVNKAKEIMAEDESVTLNELAQRVGYNCSQTLIRIFKRHEGVTPGSYRAALTADGDRGRDE